MVMSVQERLKSAFKIAAENAEANTGERPDQKTVVFDALVEAMETLKGLPDPESGWLYAQAFWPQIVHDREDVLENYREMLRRIASGEESPDVLLKRRPPSSAAIERMQAIFEVFPKCLVGKDRRRDWKILCFLATGFSTRKVAVLAQSNKQTVRDRKELQSGRIAAKLVELMPVESDAVPAPARPEYRFDRAA